MARILFAWEMGEGFGHLVPLRPVLEALVAEGHTLIIAAVDIRTAHSVLGHLTTQIVQAPMLNDLQFHLGRYAEGAADLLTMNGFADKNSLFGRHHAWRQLAALFKPDLILAEHSPGALLMARALSIPAIHAGTGFTLPPERRPILFPGFSPKISTASEDAILPHFNTLIEKDGGQPLVMLADLYNRVAKRFLLSFEELDHLGPRNGVTYYGAELPDQGETPEWPSGGPRVFAYLKPFAALNDFLSAINELSISLLMVPDRIDPAILKKHESKHIRFTTQRQNMRAVVEQADLITFNGNHGTAAAGLLGGVPMLAFPLHQEQESCARRMANAGLGAALLRNRQGKVLPLLETLLNSETQREACQKAAQRYHAFDYQNSVRDMVVQMREPL